MFSLEALVVLFEESWAIVNVEFLSQVEDTVNEDGPEQTDELWAVDFQTVVDKVLKKGYLELAM